MRETNRVCVHILLAMLLVLSLAGCGALPGFGGDTSGDTSGNQGVPTKVDNTVDSPQLGVSEDQLSFGLTKPEDPGFNEDLVSSVQGHEPMPVGDMYTEIDGYAYLLDPATLEPTGGPLDTLTHEPVVLSDEKSEVSTEPPVMDITPSSETPTEQTKYPNTGIFLEDD